jgi:TolA-binding protein
MRRWLGGTALLLAGMLTVCGAEKDSEEAAKTREERLKVKISVEFKNTMLEDALKDVVGKIDEAGKGKIEIKFNTGISRNQKINFSAKDKAAEDVLDGMLGDNLGYVIISAKKDDKTDGGLLIVAGKARGTAMEDKGKTAKTSPKEKDPDKGKTKDKTVAKDPPEKKDTPKAEPPAGGDAEKDAASKLELIRMLIDSGKKEKAKERLMELVEKYPDTKAAKEAKELLDKLK